MIYDLPSIGFLDKYRPKGFFEVFGFIGEKPEIVGSAFKFNPSKTKMRIIELGHNLIVDNGRLSMKKASNGSAPADPIVELAVGNGAYINGDDLNEDPNPPLGTDNTLKNELFRKSISSIDEPNSLATTYIFVLSDADLSVDINEFALMMQSGNMFSYKTTRNLPAGTDVYLVCRWTIQN